MPVALQFYERYSKLAWEQQIGKLASTLGHIASGTTAPQSTVLISRILREEAVLIEISASHVPPALLLELTPLQRELLIWNDLCPEKASREVLALQARHIFDRMLHTAGLA
jgi:hypothetical protein